MDGWMKRGEGVIISSGLDRLRSTIVQRLTHKVFEELKDTIVWVSFANPNCFGEYELEDSCEQKKFLI